MKSVPKLVPVVVQDVRTNDVLMLAYTNRETLALTRKTGEMHYWSRSRKRVWRKGETSGHVQKVVSLHWDCDRDAILARVEQTGPACHRGTYSCFARKPFPARTLLRELWSVFEDRKRRPEPGSYVNRILESGDQAYRKVGEEAVEFILAAKGRDRKAIAGEAADLLFHTLLALFHRGVRLEEVEAEMEERRGKRRVERVLVAVPAGKKKTTKIANSREIARDRD